MKLWGARGWGALCLPHAILGFARRSVKVVGIAASYYVYCVRVLSPFYI